MERLAVFAEISLAYKGGGFSLVVERILGEKYTKIGDGHVDGHIVYFNGQPRGIVPDAEEAARIIINARRDRGILPPHLSVYTKNWCGIPALHVIADDGRLMRPLYTAHAIKHATDAYESYAWTTSVLNGSVEYLSAEEEFSRAVIARSWDEFDPSFHTHCEIHPAAIYGIAAVQLPLSHMNQGPRTSYMTNVR